MVSPSRKFFLIFQIPYDIIIKLKNEGKLYKKETIVHTYPFSWRNQDVPVIYYARESWFIKTTSVAKRMIELNKTINWQPPEVGSGRFGNWLEENKDWALSRDRFWATPLPLWVNEDGDVLAVGSIEELKKGRHYFELPSLFGKELKYDNQVYTHSSPDFSISYPKHYKVIRPTSNEVLLVKHPLSSTPRLGVYVENKPSDIKLEDVGKKYFYSKIEQYSTSVKLVSSKQTLLNDGASAVEILFDRVVNDS